MKNFSALALALSLLVSGNAEANKVAKTARKTSGTTYKSEVKSKTSGKDKMVGTPLAVPKSMRGVKQSNIKLETFITKEATIQNTPRPKDPISGTYHQSHGESITIHPVTQKGVDLSNRSMKEAVLTPNKIRSLMVDKTKTIATTTLQKDGNVHFEVAHAANAPVATIFTSKDVGFVGQQYTRISKVTGKKRSMAIEKGQGGMPVLALTGGELTAEFKPYLNAEVVGVTQAYTPKGKRTDQVTVRGGLNALPPGSSYRVLNTDTGHVGEWRSAHPETGSFRAHIPVKDTKANNAINNVLAIEVRTGENVANSSVITTQWTFKSPSSPNARSGKQKLLETAFTAGTTTTVGPKHPVSGKEFAQANKIVKNALGQNITLASLYSRMGLSEAQQREFSFILAHMVKTEGIKNITPGNGNQFTYQNAAGQGQGWKTFQSQIHNARQWTFDPVPAGTTAE